MGNELMELVLTGFMAVFLKVLGLCALFSLASSVTASDSHLLLQIAMLDRIEEQSELT